MKQIHLIIACLLTITVVHAQKNHMDDVQIGDVLIIGKSSGPHYKYVDVPRKNFIIKRGGIANMSTIADQDIVITDIWHGKDPKVTFKRADGKKFFRVYKTLTANLDEAIEAGELKLPKQAGG